MRPSGEKTPLTGVQTAGSIAGMLTRFLVVFFATMGVVAAQADDAGGATDSGWIDLFDGKTLEGWRQRNGTATYEVVEGGLGALERFDWMVAYDMDLLSKGNHTLEVRGLNEEGVSSLPVFVTFSGTGEGMDGAGGLDADLLFLAGAVLLLGLLVMFALGGRIDPPLSLASAANEPDAAAVDAVLVEEEPKKSGKGSKT